MESRPDFTSDIDDRQSGINQPSVFNGLGYVGTGNIDPGNIINLPDKFYNRPNDDGPSPDDLPDGSKTGGPSTMPPAKAEAPIPKPETHLDLAASQL
jgi:hypothetical protein